MFTHRHFATIDGSLESLNLELDMKLISLRSAPSFHSHTINSRKEAFTNIFFLLAVLFFIYYLLNTRDDAIKCVAFFKKTTQHSSSTGETLSAVQST